MNTQDNLLSSVQTDRTPGLPGTNPMDPSKIASNIQSPHFFSTAGLPKFSKNWLDNFIPDEEL